MTELFAESGSTSVTSEIVPAEPPAPGVPTTAAPVMLGMSAAEAADVAGALDDFGNLLKKSLDGGQRAAVWRMDAHEIDLARRLFNHNLPVYKDGSARAPTPEELDRYKLTIQRTGLNPLMNQICAVWRLDKRRNDYAMTIQTQIDGYRAVASRTGEYAGQDRPVWETDEKGKLISASVTVYRLVQGHRCAFTGVAFFKEYRPAGENFMWDRMERNQLAKCAEAQALRKGFPLLAGVYVDEEMDQAWSGLPPSDAAAQDADAPSALPRDQRPAPTPAAAPPAEPSFDLRKFIAAYRTLAAKWWPEVGKEDIDKRCRDYVAAFAGGPITREEINLDLYTAMMDDLTDFGDPRPVNERK